MKTFLLLVSLMSFQASAHAGLVSALLKWFGETTVDLVKASKPVARSATRLIEDQSDHDHKGNVSDDPYEFLLKRQQNVLHHTHLMRLTHPTAPTKTQSTESELPVSRRGHLHD